jgi:hypothetical protein
MKATVRTRPMRDVGHLKGWPRGLGAAVSTIHPASIICCPTCFSKWQ